MVCRDTFPPLAPALLWVFNKQKLAMSRSSAVHGGQLVSEAGHIYHIFKYRGRPIVVAFKCSATAFGCITVYTKNFVKLVATHDAFTHVLCTRISRACSKILRVTGVCVTWWKLVCFRSMHIIPRTKKHEPTPPSRRDMS